jgi:hypothetical protein
MNELLGMLAFIKRRVEFVLDLEGVDLAHQGSLY